MCIEWQNPCYKTSLAMSKHILWKGCIRYHFIVQDWESHEWRLETFFRHLYANKAILLMITRRPHWSFSKLVLEELHIKEFYIINGSKILVLKTFYRYNRICCWLVCWESMTNPKKLEYDLIVFAVNDIHSMIITLYHQDKTQMNFFKRLQQPPTYELK